ncbi:hypothetical protein U9M48_022599 [Paspalum notatum var. saurae]|uniref:Uncharacterized protein n=1 Tax=Paspalum notatum var. saurae TaxID=547442 RepID=A0AAQ3TNG0_PASNO
MRHMRHVTKVLRTPGVCCCAQKDDCEWAAGFIQDNAFIIVASIQFRLVEDKASDAYYKLSNPRAQYIFDGSHDNASMESDSDIFCTQMHGCYARMGAP